MRSNRSDKMGEAVLEVVGKMVHCITLCLVLAGPRVTGISSSCRCFDPASSHLPSFGTTEQPCNFVTCPAQLPERRTTLPIHYSRTCKPLWAAPDGT